MRVFHLAMKDIRQVFRERQSLLFLLLMPVAITFFFGFAFSSPSPDSDHRLPVGIINPDAGSPLAGALVALLEHSSTVRPVLLGPEEAAAVDSQVLNGVYAAGLVIPAGFSELTLRGEELKLQVVIDEETQDGQTARRALQTTVTRLVSIAKTARISADVYEAQAGFANPQEREDFMQQAVADALARWIDQPIAIRVTGPALLNSDPLADNPYNQFSPGMIVQFTIFGLVQAAMVMVIERRTGVMARMLTTPMTKAELIGGHILAMFLIFFTQQVLLVLFGQFVLGVNYLRQPLAVLLVISVYALWVASLGLLISALVKKEEQVVVGAMTAMFLFSALGGAWFSLEMVGKTFAAIGRFTPTAWVIDAFQNIILRGLGTSSVLLPVAVVLAYTALFFGAAIWRFRFE